MKAKEYTWKDVELSIGGKRVKIKSVKYGLGKIHISAQQASEAMKRLGESLEELKKTHPPKKMKGLDKIGNPLLIIVGPQWGSIQRANLELQSELESIGRVIGIEKTKELFEQFKKEAYAIPNVRNSDYIIQKLRKAREQALLES